MPSSPRASARRPSSTSRRTGPRRPSPRSGPGRSRRAAGAARPGAAAAAAGRRRRGRSRPSRPPTARPTRHGDLLGGPASAAADQHPRQHGALTGAAELNVLVVHGRGERAEHAHHGPDAGRRPLGHPPGAPATITPSSTVAPQVDARLYGQRDQAPVGRQRRCTELGRPHIPSEGDTPTAAHDAATPPSSFVSARYLPTRGHRRLRRIRSASVSGERGCRCTYHSRARACTSSGRTWPPPISRAIRAVCSCARRHRGSSPWRRASSASTASARSCQAVRCLREPVGLQGLHDGEPGIVEQRAQLLLGREVVALRQRPGSGPRRRTPAARGRRPGREHPAQLGQHRGRSCGRHGAQHAEALRGVERAGRAAAAPARAGDDRGQPEQPPAGRRGAAHRLDAHRRGPKCSASQAGRAADPGADVEHPGAGPTAAPRRARPGRPGCRCPGSRPGSRTRARARAPRPRSTPATVSNSASIAVAARARLTAASPPLRPTAISAATAALTSAPASSPRPDASPDRFTPDDARDRQQRPRLGDRRRDPGRHRVRRAPAPRSTAAPSRCRPGKRLQHAGRALVGVDGDGRPRTAASPRPRGRRRRTGDRRRAAHVVQHAEPRRRPAASARDPRRAAGPTGGASGASGTVATSPAAAASAASRVPSRSKTWVTSGPHPGRRGRRRSRRARPRPRPPRARASSCSSTTRLRSRQASVVHGRPPAASTSAANSVGRQVGPVLVLADQQRVRRRGEHPDDPAHRGAARRAPRTGR